jgi:spermidine/putrescine transport system substrate-binding protein
MKNTGIRGPYARLLKIESLDQEEVMEEKVIEIPVADAVSGIKKTGLRARLVVLALSALAVLMLGGCGKSNRLYIYNWTYYTPDSVIEKFEEEYNVTVIYDEFASNEDMYAKLKAGGSGYDIVFPSADYVSIMIHQNMLEKIDKSKIPNLKNVDPAVLKKTFYDPDMEYSVPYYYGAAGITVNTAKVPNFGQSWSIFSRSDLQGRMTMLDDMREVMGGALTFLGYSVNTVDPAEIIQARNLINDVWKPNLTKFDAEAFGKGYANGDFWVVQGYPEVVFEEIAENPQLIKDTVFFIPKEGGPSYIDSMCILKGAKNADLAHKFIDFIHRPEIYAEFVDIFGFPATANVPAREYKTGPAWYSADDLVNTELKIDLGNDLDLYNDAWFNSIRIGD